MRLVIDVLIPLNVPTAELAQRIAKVKGVDGVDLLVKEVEHKVEKTSITIEGDGIELDAVREVIDKSGASLQGVDRITCGKRVVG